jgi:hypothetical protein
MVQSVDEGVGKIVEQLRVQNLLDNTIIVFTSDNGGMPTGGGLNYPFRGQKLTVYEGGLRTPALIHFPAQMPPKSSSADSYDHLFHVADFAPTLLGLSGFHSHPLLDRNGPIDGFDHSNSLLQLQEHSSAPEGVSSFRSCVRSFVPSIVSSSLPSILRLISALGLSFLFPLRFFVASLLLTDWVLNAHVN